MGSDARIDQLEGRNPESSDDTRNVQNMIYSHLNIEDMKDYEQFVLSMMTLSCEF